MSELRKRSRQVQERIGRNVPSGAPRVSVVITAYNDSRHISETLDSVINQKFREFEIILVNDGSKDTELLEREIKLRMEDLTYIRQRHAGEGAARNTGIEVARGEYVAFLQAGDVWDPSFLAAQYVFLARGNYDVVYSDGAIFGTNSAYRQNYSDKYPTIGDVTFESLLSKQSHVLISATIARRTSLVRAGLFPTVDLARPGLHLWLRMAKDGARFGYCPKQLIKRRGFRETVATDGLSQVEQEKYLFELIRETIDLSDRDRTHVERHISGLEAAMALEQGTSFLKSGDYSEALTAFRVASHHRPSFRMKAITWLTKVAPKAALKFAMSEKNAENRYYVPRPR